MYRIGVDLGGTNIAAGLVNEKLDIVDRESVKTSLPRPLKSIADDIAALARRLTERNGLIESDIAGLGVGVPCTANEDTGHMEDADTLAVGDAAILDMLRRRTTLPVCFGNDANAAAWGEYLAGGHNARSLILVTLGTGVGGGIVLDGRLWKGVNYAAGEFGHMVIDPDGPECLCGRRGCFEALASASALIRDAKRAMENGPDTLLRSFCGGDIEKVEAKTVFECAEAGDETAISLLDRYTGYIADGLANIINIFEPEVVCIGGGVSAAGERLIVPVREKTLARIYTRHSDKITRIELASLGNDAGIIGAALLGLDMEDGK